ncbi:MAG: hypothetical protein AAB509_02595, partial [Patescibacteria group bacterium]
IEEKQRKFGEAATQGPKVQYTNARKLNRKDELEKDRKKAFDEKEKKDIEEDLDALKKSAKGEQEEEDSIFSKIKIPRAKKFMSAQKSFGKVEGGDSLGKTKPDIEKVEDGQKQDYQNHDEKDGKPTAEPQKADMDYQPASSGKSSAIQSNRLEILRGAEIKIPQSMESEQLPKDRESANPVLDREDISSNLHNDELHNKIRKTEPKISNDGLIFRGKSEISRIDLRQKLRYDPKVYQAQKEAGLFNLSRADRVKLEKEVFSQAYGRNISKTDLKWGIKKLNQKMFGVKNLVEKGKIRKEIKFFKKIGGIK